MKLLSISGFACDGKTTLMKELSESNIVCYEHAGSTLSLGQDKLNIFTDLLSFQFSLIITEIERIKFLQSNERKFKNKKIYFDRNLIDILTFLKYHSEKSKKISSTTSEIDNMIDSILEHIKTEFLYYPIFDKILLIEPCENNDFIKSNCLRKDRIDTINVNEFIEHGKYWFNTYLDIYEKISSTIAFYSHELLFIEHPSKIGFDDFYKKIFEEF